MKAVTILKNEGQLESFVGKSISVRSEECSERFEGKIVSVKGPMIRIELAAPFTFGIGENLECGAGDDSLFLKLQGTVVSQADSYADLWITVQSIVPGVVRAPRVNTPNLTITIENDERSMIASMCDCSTSGLRISTLESFPVGSELVCRLGQKDQEIFLITKVVRAVNLNESEFMEFGLQIVDCDRLSRARWNHLVSSLLRRVEKSA